MARREHFTTDTAASGKIATVDQAMGNLLSALRSVDSDAGLVEELIAAWQDLSFDDRRYLGTSFPRLTNCLLQIEDALG